jgi:hypothetical protein
VITDWQEPMPPAAAPELVTMVNVNLVGEPPAREPEMLPAAPELPPLHADEEEPPQVPAAVVAPRPPRRVPPRFHPPVPPPVCNHPPGTCTRQGCPRE